jgi:hypothetical protein
MTELRLFIAFSMLLFVASLASPMPGPLGSAKTAWEFLAGRPAIHYWFFPTLAFSWGIVWMLFGRKSNQLSQAVATLLVLVLPIGVARDWNYVSFPNLDFGHYAAVVIHARRGEAITIPETPPGWTLQLVKR